MSNTLNPPPRQNHNFKKAAILFAGGPAPAANAVISAAAASFLKAGVDVVGIKNGYSNLIEYCPDRGLCEHQHYINVSHKFLSRSRNKQGILIGTARANPGKDIHSPADLQDPIKSELLRRTYEGLCSIGVDALISIGGDDTLKTANKFRLYQASLPEDAQRIPVVHLPKTIDNDYHGIDFTFGYFTAVEFLASEIRNLIHDAEACNAYFVVETMGRSAGWLAYGAAIAGEASLVISVEDIIGDYRTNETHVDEEGHAISREVMNIDRVVKRIVKSMLAREAEGKEFGVIVLAEGLAELLPFDFIRNVPRDDHGHISISAVNLCEVFTRAIESEYHSQTKRKRKVKGLQLGYESRCAKPHAFDVMLGSQLGVGAYRALVEKQLDGVMVSVCGQLDLKYEPFENLIDPKTLVTRVRFIKPGSDFHFLARFLETQVNE